MKVIIHDLGEEITCLLKKTNEDLVVIHADNQYAHCRGCFKCWLKNAGYCVMRDSLRHIGALIGKGDSLIIVSRWLLRRIQQPCQGRFGSLNRSFSSIFHLARRPDPPHKPLSAPETMRVFFYGECTEFEQETATELVERNRLNLDYEKADVVFFQNIEQLKEASL